jgi:argininosuccinate lyase
MTKLWAGRTTGQTAEIADAFNRSIQVDKRMVKEDIAGSIAHAAMLASQEILTGKESDLIVSALGEILDDVLSGKLLIDEDAEDIHMFVEAELTRRIGDTGKKLHTARSRNDQVAVDLRMNLRGEADKITDLLLQLIAVLNAKAKQYSETILPAYTHLQRAQPITFGHHLLAYISMFMRDVERLADARKRINISPLGSAALAGTTYPIDRKMTADHLGFSGVASNSMDAVSDRDFVIELTGVLALIMVHLSRFAEEIILWCSWEYQFIELSDAYTTGSSIMPQKKNPDMAELVRGKTGRVFGALTAILTVMKGLPLAYNKDMQEDKEIVFDACDTVSMCLEVFIGMIAEMKAKEENMIRAAEGGFINATDLADYLVTRGLPFRDAYRIVGKIVAVCIKEGYNLESFPLERYKTFSERFEDDLYEVINLKACVERRISEGGTSFASVKKQIQDVSCWLENKGGLK